MHHLLLCATDNFIDGEAFKCVTECDIKEMVPQIGIVKKILRIQSECFGNLSLSSPLPLRNLEHGNYSDDLSNSSSSESPTSEASSTMSRARDTLIIPTSWRPEIQDCIRDKMLNISARNEIVRTLVNILFTRYPSPTREQCASLARSLILQYGFMKDSQGTTYVS